MFRAVWCVRVNACMGIQYHATTNNFFVLLLPAKTVFKWWSLVVSSAFFSMYARLFFTLNVGHRGWSSLEQCSWKWFVVFELWRGDLKSMAKSDHQDKDAYASSGMCPHKFFLFSNHLHQACKQIYAVSFAISFQIVMSKYDLLISLSITHSSMIMCNGRSLTRSCTGKSRSHTSN